METSSTTSLQNSIIAGNVDISGLATELQINRGSVAPDIGKIELAGTAGGSSAFIANQGTFLNANQVEASGSGAILEFDYGTSNSYSPSIANIGQIEATSGGTVLFEEFGPNGPLTNAWQIKADGGEVAVIGFGGAPSSSWQPARSQ